MEINYHHNRLSSRCDFGFEEAKREDGKASGVRLYSCRLAIWLSNHFGKGTVKITLDDKSIIIISKNSLNDFLLRNQGTIPSKGNYKQAILDVLAYRKERQEKHAQLLSVRKTPFLQYDELFPLQHPLIQEAARWNDRIQANPELVPDEVSLAVSCACSIYDVELFEGIAKAHDGMGPEGQLVEHLSAPHRYTLFQTIMREKDPTFEGLKDRLIAKFCCELEQSKELQRQEIINNLIICFTPNHYIRFNLSFDKFSKLCKFFNFDQLCSLINKRTTVNGVPCSRSVDDNLRHLTFRYIYENREKYKQAFEKLCSTFDRQQVTAFFSDHEINSGFVDKDREKDPAYLALGMLQEVLTKRTKELLLESKGEARFNWNLEQDALQLCSYEELDRHAVKLNVEYVQLLKSEVRLEYMRHKMSDEELYLHSTNDLHIVNRGMPCAQDALAIILERCEQGVFDRKVFKNLLLALHPPRSWGSSRADSCGSYWPELGNRIRRIGTMEEYCEKPEPAS